jgi:hypothetical protein
LEVNAKMLGRWIKEYKADDSQSFRAKVDFVF